MSSRPDMGEDLRSMVYLEANSLLDVNWWNEIYYMLPKYNGRTGIDWKIPIPTGTNRNEEMSNRFWARVQNPTTHILIDIKFHTTLCFDVMLSRPTGAKVQFPGTWGVGSHLPYWLHTSAISPNIAGQRLGPSRHPVALSDGWLGQPAAAFRLESKPKPAGAHSTCGYGCDGPPFEIKGSILLPHTFENILG